MGFANNVIPAWMVPEIKIDKRGLYMAISPDWTCGNPECSLCEDTRKANEKNKSNAKEIDMTVTLTAATADFKTSVETRVKNDKASVDVNYFPYNSKDTATLNLYAPSAYSEGTYANVRLNADDLKNLQDAIYKVRVEIAKAGVKNDEVYPF